MTQPKQPNEREDALLLQLRATFNASGIAETSITVGAWERWKVTLFSTTTTSTTQTRHFVYRGLFQQQIDFSVTGNGDTSNTDLEFRQGATLSVRWTGGTVGAFAALTVEGQKFVRVR